jgi:hypothetical protein
VSEARQLVAEAFEVEQRGFDLRAGAAGALAALGPLAIGVAVDEPAIGITASLGGLNAALTVPLGVDLRRGLLWGLLAVFGGAASAALATLVAPSTVALVAATFVWTAVWSYLRAGGRTGALVAFVIAAQLVILAGLPSEGLGDTARGLWHLAGGALGLTLMIAACGFRSRNAGHFAATQPHGGTAALLEAGLATLRAAARDRRLATHALRLAGIVAATTLLYRELDLIHGYWVPVTILAVLQPEHDSRVRAVQRAAGTFGGTAVVVAIVALTASEWTLVAFAAASAFFLYALRPRGYFWLVVLLTPTVPLMTSALDYQSVEIAIERAVNSAAGIAIGLGWGELMWRLPLHRRSA